MGPTSGTHVTRYGDEFPISQLAQLVAMGDVDAQREILGRRDALTDTFRGLVKAAAIELSAAGEPTALLKAARNMRDRSDPDLRAEWVFLTALEVETTENAIRTIAREDRAMSELQADIRGEPIDYSVALGEAREISDQIAAKRL
ncbi:MAG: hypothetical protein M3Y79_11445 [Pseudomonadota bacterium]|nr:hypothetical protein [Pseudomonadota bacterium]